MQLVRTRAEWSVGILCSVPTCVLLTIEEQSPFPFCSYLAVQEAQSIPTYVHICARLFPILYGSISSNLSDMARAMRVPS